MVLIGIVNVIFILVYGFDYFRGYCFLVVVEVDKIKYFVLVIYFSVFIFEEVIQDYVFVKY